MSQIRLDTYYQLPPQGYYPIPPQEEKEINLREYLIILRKRMWTIIACFLIVVVATVIGTYTVRPVYRATATVQIGKENPQIVDFREIFQVSAWDTDYYQTHYQILASRNLARRVVDTLKMAEHPEFLPEPETSLQKLKSNILNTLFKLKSNIKNFFFGLITTNKDSSHNKNLSDDSSEELSKDPSSADKDSPETLREILLINQFIRQLKIEPVRNTRLVNIHFDSYYPELASRVPNTVATTYIQMNLDNRFNATEQAEQQLNKQLEVMRAKVETADEALQDFGAKHDFIFLDEKERNVTLQRLSDLNEALAKAESERMSKEALYKQTRQSNFDAIPSILENKLIQELKQNYLQLEVQYTKLSEIFKPEYPEMVRIKKQMEIVQKRLDAELNKCIHSIKNEYEFCLRRESLIRAAFEQQKAKATEMQQKAIHYNILKREADTNRELYKNLLQRMKEAGIQAGITASNIQVVDQAELPTHPYKPNLRHNIKYAAMIGLLLGLGLAFFFEYLDNTIKTPDDLEQLIRLPSLGMVPELSFEKRRQLERGVVYPVELITFGHPKSMLSEVYRNIRTSILLSFSEGPPKTLVVSSPRPMEGKTTTAINMAIAFSQTGAPVLIIDGDMRKPRVHTIFKGGNGVGLSNFLSGNAELNSVIHKTDMPNLYYIPSGPIPPNPSELLGSNLFKNMVQFLRKKFDHIILDSPPVLSFVDSLVLSNSVDGVVLVVLGGKTPKEALRQSKSALLQVNAKILGVVINRVDIHRNGYYYDYRNYYYYGKDRKKKELQEGRKKELVYKLNKKSIRT